MHLPLETTPPPRKRIPLLRPVQEFLQTQAAGGVILLACAVIALIWANTPAGASYFALWETIVTVGAGSFAISKPLLLWINDGLMAIFFFVVGLEIKREILVGELSSPKKAALPLAAAAGGMLVPAAIYAVLNTGTAGAAGWGIPMATDIAFALGVLALLGSRAPLALKIFLTALAIVDDLGAVLVIAIFYTEQIVWSSLGMGGIALALLVLANKSGVRQTLVYTVLGLALWLAFLKSGVHATIAGILLALTIPAKRRIDAPQFLEQARSILNVFAGDTKPLPAEPTERQRAAIHALEETCEGIETPLLRMEHALHKWVAFFIMPIFALANAGVAIGGNLGAVLGNSITLGVVLGLVLGKQIGVTLFTWLAVRFGIAEMPHGITMRHIYGISALCGIGFTMSLFIAGLAFEDAMLLNSAKIGILAASILSGLVGWLLLARLSEPAAGNRTEISAGVSSSDRSTRESYPAPDAAET